MATMKQRFCDSVIETYSYTDESGRADRAISEQIALLIVENEKLRRIASDLSWHNERIRNSGAPN